MELRERAYCIYPVFNVRVILFLSLCSDLESETGDDSKISSDDEVATGGSLRAGHRAN